MSQLPTPAEFERTMDAERAKIKRAEEALKQREADYIRAYAAGVKKVVDAVGPTLQLRARLPGTVPLSEVKQANSIAAKRWLELKGETPWWSEPIPEWAQKATTVQELQSAAAAELFHTDDYSTAAFLLKDIECFNTLNTKGALYIYFTAVSECGCKCKSMWTEVEYIGGEPHGSGMGYYPVTGRIVRPPRVETTNTCFMHTGKRTPVAELWDCLAEQHPEIERYLPRSR